jgi:cysteine desulfuration protein SufE
MFESCLEKQRKIAAQFQGCDSDKARYEKIIELGRKLPKLAGEHKTPENLVKGCQSLMYLYTRIEGDRLIFEGESDALISAGLAYLMISVYSGETPETILKCPPQLLNRT